jgi:acetolactate synthase-1/2/3 large subunit
MINSGMPEFAAAAAGLGRLDSPPWSGWTRTARADYLQTLEPVSMSGELNLSEVVTWLRSRLPPGSIITNGAGNFSGWAQRFYQYTGFRTQLGPTNGAMGYGVPAAVAAKLVHPDRMVVCFSGDGDFLMNGQELATAVQYRAPVVFVVINNGMYGTIRMHQEREYPTRVIGTELRNPDFAAYARAFGGFGATVDKTADFARAFEQAEQSGKPSIIHVKVDTNALTPGMSLEAIRAKSLAAAKG